MAVRPGESLALQPLLDQRKSQVQDETLVKILDGPAGHRPGDTASAWLTRRNDDARNYIIFGDPAVRVRMEDMPEIVAA